ncbi:hypothetical protein SARC_00687 [Sphaeroforma arctica JP610]|uniref:DUF3592 domain-containing protein n=1 Tax=Sphaeroforma arctica JP610 TaxID=667725 RepID=A0A0L0GE40_9EUKA|nr:hypothetical protein SARC_00687 [Sphaeroforma arctica JP610]KNC87159.1 hypothetical protein SARC_00687 [Sphaeroforma arctica JP610]|eukprot:XP_014161061.1 hypothetical protein SARC_00687 [Sphaeroforma arctica JP610]
MLNPLVDTALEYYNSATDAVGGIIRSGADEVFDFTEQHIGEISQGWRLAILFGLGFFMLLCMTIYVYNMEDEYAEKRKNRGSPAPPRPRPSKPVRKYDTVSLMTLNILNYVLAICSILIIMPGAMGLNAILSHSFEWDEPHYGLEYRGRDIIANSAFILLGVACIIGFLYPVYRSQQIMKYGTEIEGVVTASVPDYTISVFIFPASRIEWSYKPEGSQREEEGLWKSTPFSTWARTNYPEGSKVTVIYDPENPQNSICPSLLSMEYTNYEDKTK